VRRRRLPRVFTLLLVAAVAVAATWLILRNDTESPSSLDGLPLAQVKSGTAAVTTRTISSVMAMNAVVVAAPTFRLTAPARGSFKRNRNLRGRVEANTVVGWVKVGSESIPVRTPVQATLVETLVADGTQVPVGMPLVMLKATGFGLQATVADAARYRLLSLTGSATAQIEKGPGPFPCPVLGSPEPVGTGVTVTCGAPPDLRLFEGLLGVVAAQTGIAKDVLALPVDAVAGAAERGLVSLRGTDGTFTDRPVQLGITDGSFVEIKVGLKPGDVVQNPGPSLLSGTAGSK
jgi:membrane fusion protein, macrolide-specific efflux system